MSDESPSMLQSVWGHESECQRPRRGQDGIFRGGQPSGLLAKEKAEMTLPDQPPPDWPGVKRRLRKRR